MSRSLKKTGERSFTINNAYHVDGCKTKFSHGDFTGRYQEHRPANAASKALTNLCNLKGIHGQCTLYIEMRETTQGSKHKVYSYHVKRVKYDKPQDVKGAPREYYNVILSAKAPTKKCKKSHKSSGRMRSISRRKSMTKKH